MLEEVLRHIRKSPGVDYADIRCVETRVESMFLRGGGSEEVLFDRGGGTAVRALVRGCWGFAATPGQDEASAMTAARRAVEIAKAVAAVSPTRVRLSPEPVARGRWETPVEIDPFVVDLEQKRRDLRRLVSGVSAHASVTGEARMLWRREDKTFASTDGTFVEQSLSCGGIGLRATAVGDGATAVRSWPMGHDPGVTAGGYELVESAPDEDALALMAEEAQALLRAPACPAGRRTLILDCPQLAMQIHETCGHPTEGDRALGWELSLAGGSFLVPQARGKLRYGADIVNLTADSLRDGGVGSYGWDDEGVEARRTPLVEGGVFVGYLSSRETAAALGLGRSAGCLRADSWARPPIVRMNNVCLEPDDDGPDSLEQLIEDTRDGLLMVTNRSWSIDDVRLGFQFGCEAAWEIKRGRRVRLLSQPIYRGSTPSFWSGCRTIGSPRAFRMMGIATCGKGDPLQLMSVSHGCAPACFEDVEVGAA